jgi:hypothetical protein
MSAPVKTKDWEYLLNQTAAHSTHTTMRATLLLGLKNAFLNSGVFSTPWQVDRSCSSTVAGTVGDGVDRWSETSDIVWSHTGGAARSWFVFVQPNYFGASQPLYMLWETRQSASSQNSGALGVYLSTNAFTGGGTTSRPTATNEWAVLGTDETATNSNWQGSIGSGETSKRYHVMASDDGQEWRVSIAFEGAAQNVWIIGRPANPPSGWSTPLYALIYGSTNAATNAATAAGVGSATQRVALWDSSAGRFTCRLTGESLNSGGDYVTSCAANTFDSSRPLSSVGLYSSSGTVGHMGALRDVWWTRAADGVGTTYPSAQPDFCNIGGLVLPWDGATTPAMT